jgi:two-component system nitrogen regulation sensor histidine kinase NtrY
MSTVPSDPPSETLAETSDLPDAERRRRRRDLLITAAVMAAIGAVVVVERRISSLPEALPFGDSLLFLFLNAFNVVLLVLLIYLISRSFVKLIFERRSGVLGSHLNLKFALALFLVATVPMGLQYVVSSSFITASIDTWFSLQMDRAIDDSREVADAYYDAWTGNALHFGTQIAEEIRAPSSRSSSGSTTSVSSRSFRSPKPSPSPLW